MGVKTALMGTQFELEGERINRVCQEAYAAITETFADGREHGKQRGEWATRSAAEHLAHVEGHARAALVTTGEARALHLRHLVTRAVMAMLTEDHDGK